jgi:hypothetical protein
MLKQVREYFRIGMTYSSNDMPFIKFIAGVCYESAKEYLRLLED